MDSLPELLSENGILCSRLLSQEDAEAFSRCNLFRARLADSIAEAYRPHEADGFDHWQSKATQYRDLAWTTLPDDRFWLTVDPSTHPEVKIGVASLVIVRNGKVVFRERLEVF